MTKKEIIEIGQGQLPEDISDLTCYSYFLLDKLTQDEIRVLKTRFENIYKKAIKNLFFDAFKKQKKVNLSLAPVEDCLVQHVNNRIYLIYPIVYKCIFDEILGAVHAIFKNEYQHIYPLDYCFWVGEDKRNFNYLRLYANQEQADAYAEAEAT